jgi:hypothetical protein
MYNNFWCREHHSFLKSSFRPPSRPQRNYEPHQNETSQIPFKRISRSPSVPSYRSAYYYSQKTRDRAELNGTQFDVLPHIPSALEFARIVKISRPVLILGKSSHRSNVRVFLTREKDRPSEDLDQNNFSDDNLKARMGDQVVSIACTPNG